MSRAPPGTTARPNRMLLMPSPELGIMYFQIQEPIRCPSISAPTLAGFRPG